MTGDDHPALHPAVDVAADLMTSGFSNSSVITFLNFGCALLNGTLFFGQVWMLWQDAVVVDDVDRLTGRHDLHAWNEAAAVLIDLGFDAANGIFFPSFGSLIADHDVLHALVGRHQEGILQVGRLAADRLILGDRDLLRGRGVAAYLTFPTISPAMVGASARATRTGERTARLRC